MFNFREQWGHFEENLSTLASDVKALLREKLSEQSFDGALPLGKGSSWEDYVAWGKNYVDEIKKKSSGEKVEKAKEDFYSILRALGVNDALLRETFAANKKELLDPLVGELVAIVTLILGWTKKDKEAFSKALGEIGVLGVFAAKPFVCLVAICGLAYGYNRTFHKESFKKGGIIGLAGLGTAWLAPAGFVGLLAALVVIIYLNKKLSVDRPIEHQIKEIFKQIKQGQFVKDVRQSWNHFEDFLEKLFIKPTSSREF